MKLFSQKDPVQAELEKMKKQEGRFLEKNRERKELFLNRFLQDKIPDRLQGTLEAAFARAFSLIFEKDYIKQPKPNGYRSLHVIIRIPVYFLDKKELIPVEIQLRTIAMDFWASLEHDLKYKAVRRIQGIDSYHELKDCSRIIEEVESRMQILARALDADDED